MAYYGGLELLDIEEDYMRDCKAFIWTDRWLYIDEAAKSIIKKDGVNLTMAQRQIYIFWKHIFKEKKPYKKLYSGEGEISRRIALAIYNDRTRSGNVGNMMKAIRVRIEKGGK